MVPPATKLFARVSKVDSGARALPVPVRDGDALSCRSVWDSRCHPREAGAAVQRTRNTSVKTGKCAVHSPFPSRGPRTGGSSHNAPCNSRTAEEDRA